MGPNVFSIKDQLSLPPEGEFILLDTNVIYDIMANPSTPRSIDVKAFMQRLAINNNIAVICVKTWEELQIGLERTHLPKNKRILAQNPSIYFNKVNTEMSKIKSALNTFPNIYPDPLGEVNQTILSIAQNNQLQYNLRWGDAVIYTLGVENGINHICSLDGDLVKVQNNQVSMYTDHNIFLNQSGQLASLPSVANSTSQLIQAPITQK